MESSDIIRAMLAPLAEYYEHEDHEEIAINRPEEVWCRRHKPDPNGHIWVRYPDDRLTLRYLLTVCRAVANAFDKSFNPDRQDKPCTVFADLPPSGHRFSAIAGHNVVYDQTLPEGGIGMCIRKGSGASRSYTVDFADWGLIEGRGVQEGYHHLKQLTDGRVDAIKALKEAVQHGHNILISGGTSTGKTTLFNRIIEEVDPRTRILTVEDTREIRLGRNPNHLHLMLSRTASAEAFGYNQAIDIIMRFTPDIVLVGEVSTTNAGALWRLTGTGHGAMMTTIHASTVEQCYDVLYERISGCIPNLDRQTTIEKIRENFVIIQMSRDLDGKRVITDIEAPVPPAAREKAERPVDSSSSTVEGMKASDQARKPRTTRPRATTTS